MLDEVLENSLNNLNVICEKLFRVCVSFNFISLSHMWCLDEKLINVTASSA